jgi:hypothetical protein
MTTSSAATRVLLMPEARSSAAGPQAQKIRRYRLARLRLLERRDGQALRHSQLTRTYD